MGVLDFFTPEAGQRRRQWLNRIDNKVTGALEYAMGPDLSPQVMGLLGAVGALSDGQDFVDTKQAGDKLMGSRSFPEAVTNMAEFAAPAAALMIPGVSNRAIQGGADMAQDAVRYMRDESGALNYNFGHDYQSGHSAPLRGRDSAPLDNLAGDIYPDDIYSANAVQYYGTGDNAVDRKTIQIMQKVKGNPDAVVTIYRAVPNDVNDINAGDWVTVNKDYAKQHAKYWADGEAKILEEKVRAGDLFTDGNSIHEFGWSPEPRNGQPLKGLLE